MENASTTPEVTLIHALNAIGIRLSAEKDIDKLTRLILDECMRITQSDGGSIYTRESDDEGTWITIRHALNRSRDFPFERFSLPINNTSFAGYCAATGMPLNFSSLENTEALVGIRHNNVFDRMNNYSTRNMLVIPMKNLEGDTIGVLQLINKKINDEIRLTSPEDYADAIVPYTDFEEEIVTSLASQAAILLERTHLYEEIQALFRTFSESMVTALDKRDPVTAGHSKRVADYAVALAGALNNQSSVNRDLPVFSDGDIQKLYYAGLLHDIGKVGVEEALLTKSTRLSEERMDIIRYRFRVLKLTLTSAEVLTEQDRELSERLDSWMAAIVHLNKLGAITSEEASVIREICSYDFQDLDGLRKPLLSAYEAEALTVLRGNLTSEERRAIEQHPKMTLEVLKEIRWSRDLTDVPLIAASHHERLNGSGYPSGAQCDAIPIMSRILAIVDIFDAMTSKDRPYKPAVPIEDTLDVLMEEVRHGNLDPMLTDCFISTKAYQEVFDASFPGGSPLKDA